MTVNKTHKSTLFTELFREPDKLRELYNAVANTNYGEDTPIEINTLKDVFFRDLKNDVSFTIGGKFVVLIEHQSTINPNMPLRCLMYIARVYEKITDKKAIYRKDVLKIPTPEFIVLYNGTDKLPDMVTLHLSDAFKETEETHKLLGSLNLSVSVVNINPGYNDELLTKSDTLKGYSVFVGRVNDNRDNGMDSNNAIREAIEWCKRNDYLATFLSENSSEVENMLMTEFDINVAKEVWQEEAREEADKMWQEFVSQKDAQHKSVIADKDATLAEKDAELADKDAELADKDIEFAKKEKEYLAELAELKAQFEK